MPITLVYTEMCEQILDRNNSHRDIPASATIRSKLYAFGTLAYTSMTFLST